ncbi:MAG: hypothetical protein IJH62_04865 [Mogibacterium sp.]|nr:hypothetical protein [Mogibacterium sp.]
MYDKKKKFRRSPVTVICFVLAALMLIYACYQGGSTIHQINDYYAQYGMKAKPAEYLTYVSQSIMATLINAIVLFMLAKIHDDVRRNNPANFMSDEELVEAAEAKKAAKDSKQFEKGEKAAAKSADKGDVKVSVKTESEEPVVVDFAVADVEVSAEKKTAKKPAAKKASGSAAKKPAAKKTSAKKTSDEKAAPKKTAAKKAAPKKKAAAEKADEKTEE